MIYDYKEKEGWKSLLTVWVKISTNHTSSILKKKL